jgi:hypothetical protein
LSDNPKPQSQSRPYNPHFRAKPRPQFPEINREGPQCWLHPQPEEFNRKGEKEAKLREIRLNFLRATSLLRAFAVIFPVTSI